MYMVKACESTRVVPWHATFLGLPALTHHVEIAFFLNRHPRNPTYLQLTMCRIHANGRSVSGMVECGTSRTPTFFFNIPLPTTSLRFQFSTTLCLGPSWLGLGCWCDRPRGGGLHIWISNDHIFQLSVT